MNSRLFGEKDVQWKAASVKRRFGEKPLHLASKTLDMCRHTKYKWFFDVDINEYLDILKGVGAQIVIWNFYDQVVKVEKGWVEQEFVLLIIAALPSEDGLPNE